MRLGDLRNIICCGVILSEYIDGEVEVNELIICHSLDIPKEYNERVVVDIFPVDESLFLLLEPKHEEDRNE